LGFGILRHGQVSTPNPLGRLPVGLD
jgi:hypothetical protein